LVIGNLIFFATYIKWRCHFELCEKSEIPDKFSKEITRDNNILLLKIFEDAESPESFRFGNGLVARAFACPERQDSGIREWTSY
jgi:hypothetical protein